MSDEPIPFKVFGGQHEVLRIPKAGLPLISDAEVNVLSACRDRYDIVFGNIDPGEWGLPVATQESDIALLAEIIQKRTGRPTDEIHAIILKKQADERSAILVPSSEDEDQDEDGEEDEDEDEDWDEDLIEWNRDDACDFIHLLSRIAKTKVATFWYIYECDEVAAGIFTVEGAELAGLISENYAWALGFSVGRSKYLDEIWDGLNNVYLREKFMRRVLSSHATKSGSSGDLNEPIEENDPISIMTRAFSGLKKLPVDYKHKLALGIVAIVSRAEQLATRNTTKTE